MTVTCKNCGLAPVVCQFSTNGLELICCSDCMEAIVKATHNVYTLNETDPADLALLGETERQLQALVARGEWDPEAMGKKE